MTFEKKYWSEGEFSLINGEDYNGYVGIYEGEAYIYDTYEKLIKNKTYLTQFNVGEQFFDRIMDEKLTLPYTKKEIQLSPNDFLYKGSIKNIIQKLQENNDYIYKCSTISDTLIPAVNDCSILATVNNSKYVFVGKSGEEYDYCDIFNFDDIKEGFITNKNWDKEAETVFEFIFKDEDGIDDFTITHKPKSSYDSTFKEVPNVLYKIQLQEGILKRYDLLDQKMPKTSLDSTFYPQIKEDGSVTEPKFNFNDIVDSEIIATDVGMQRVIYSEGEYKKCPADYEGNDFEMVKRVRLLLFIAFKNKVIILTYVYYPDNFACNKSLGSTINFNDTNDILVIDTVDPSNKNSLNFLEISDIHIRGNYMYLVDAKLNMILRYDIEPLRVQQALTGWNIKNVRLLDCLQGEGTVRDDIYFKNPCAICADDENIYVADKGNGCIKKYTADFDYINTIRNGNFANQEIQTIAINPYSFTLDDGTKLNPNSLWIFSTTGTSLYVHILNGTRVSYTHRIDKLEMLKDKYMWDEEFKCVKFSFTDSNYYYICTTKRVYKLHLSKPFYPFASMSYFKQRMVLSSMVWSRIPYPWHYLPADDIVDDNSKNITWDFRPAATSAEILDNKSFCLCGVDNYTLISEKDRAQFNGDIILHIGNLYDQAKIDTFCKRNNCNFKDIPQYELSQMIKCSGVFLYNETSSFISSLSKLDFPSYISEDIEDINSTEYVNHITFNKIMYKMIYNLINIKNHLIGKMWGAYNLDGLMCYDQLEYDDFFQQLKIERADDFFVHSNESMSIMVNRIFEKVYDLQEKILRRMEAKYRAISSFTNNSFRII